MLYLRMYQCRVDERLFHWSTKQSADGPRRLQQFSTGVSFRRATTTSVGFISGNAHTAASAYLIREIPTAYHFSWNAPFPLVTFTKCAWAAPRCRLKKNGPLGRAELMFLR